MMARKSGADRDNYLVKMLIWNSLREVVSAEKVVVIIMRVGCKNQAKHTKDDHYRQNYIAVCQSKMVIDER